MHPRNDSTNRFGLFEKFAGDYKNKKILDYGGNRGNLLYFSQGKIREENYTCIDIEKEAIESGKNEFPNAKFLHYNRFSPMYNEGNMDEPFPILEGKFDICFAYSVFTHTDFFTFQQTIKHLQKICDRLIISFVNNNNIAMKKWVHNKRCNEYGSCIELNLNKNYNYLINNNKIIKNQKIYTLPERYFFTFYDNTFIQLTFDSDVFLNKAGQDFVLIN